MSRGEGNLCSCAALCRTASPTSCQSLEFFIEARYITETIVEREEL